jgi:hypothetical protein
LTNADFRFTLPAVMVAMLPLDLLLAVARTPRTCDPHGFVQPTVIEATKA